MNKKQLTKIVMMGKAYIRLAGLVGLLGGIILGYLIARLG